jgi:hypothetical protein
MRNFETRKRGISVVYQIEQNPISHAERSEASSLC